MSLVWSYEWPNLGLIWSDVDAGRLLPSCGPRVVSSGPLVGLMQAEEPRVGLFISCEGPALGLERGWLDASIGHEGFGQGQSAAKASAAARPSCMSSHAIGRAPSARAREGRRSMVRRVRAGSVRTSITSYRQAAAFPGCCPARRHRCPYCARGDPDRRESPGFSEVTSFAEGQTPVRWSQPSQNYWSPRSGGGPAVAQQGHIGEAEGCGGESSMDPEVVFRVHVVREVRSKLRVLSRGGRGLRRMCVSCSSGPRCCAGGVPEGVPA